MQGVLRVSGQHRRRLLGIGLIIGSTLLLAACGGSDGQTDSKQVMRWSVANVDGPRKITVRGGVPQCEGLPEPKVVDVVKRERGSKVFVRVVVDVPAAARDPSEYQCAGYVQGLEAVISLPRPLSELVLFDSGVNPPAQRWPEKSPSS